MDGGGVVQVASGVGVGGAFAPDDDVVQAESEDHFFRNAILLGLTCRAPIGVGAKAFVEVAAVVVDQVVAAVYDFFGDQERGALGLGAVYLSGVEAVHAFVVDRIYVGDFLKERRDVDQGKQDDRTGKLRGIDLRRKFFQGNDGGVFGAVRAGDQGEDGAGFGAVDDDDGDASCCVGAGGNVEIAVGALAGRGSGGADGVGTLCGSRSGECGDDCGGNDDASEHVASLGSEGG